MKTNHFPLRYFSFAIFTSVLILPAALAQSGGAKLSTEAELKEDLAAGPCKNDDRVEGVKKLFIKMGVVEAELKAEKVKGIQNVIFTKKGKTDETVIVGGHYDKVPNGCGILDNWSGIVILAHLYRTLNAMDTQKTYVFVAFDKEELGLLGSAAMAKSIPKEKRPSYCSMVNLDSFGLGYPVILENVSNGKMSKAAKDLAGELKMPITGLDLTGRGVSDSASFNDKEIPAITISALSSKWPQYLHSPFDTMENTNVSSVRVGYRFALEYLAKIDVSACSVYR